MGVSYFYFCCCDEILLRKKGFILAYSSRLQSITVGKSRQEGEATSHIYSQQQEKIHVGLPPLLHSYAVQGPTQEKVQPTFRVGLLISTQLGSGTTAMA